MKKIILFILMFCSFSYVAAFDKAPVVELTAPFPDLIPRADKVRKIIAGTQSEFGNVDTDMLYLSTATTAIKRPVSMKNHTHFDFSSFMIPNAELSASSKITYPYPSIINDGGAFFGQAISKNDAVGSTSVVTADKYAKPTIKIAKIATNNKQYAKGYMYTYSKTLSSVSGMIVTNDNAEIKDITKIGLMNADVFAYNPYAVIIGNEHKFVAGSKTGMTLGHFDYGA